MSGNANNYVQAYVNNQSTGTGASADLVVYPDNGTDASGWVDMGITSSTFSNATYGITGANEGYLFMSAPSGASKTGNLVIATDSTGTQNAIKFATAGFGSTTERMRIDSSGNVGIGTSSPANRLDVSVTGADVAVRAVTTSANYATFRLKNSAQDYSMQIRTDQSNAWTLRDETAGANRLLVDTSGRVTNPYQVAVAAYSNTSQSIADGSAVVIALNATRYNIGSAFNTSTYLFTAPIAGYYMCTGIVSWTGTFSAARQFCMIYKNGGQDNGLGVQIPRASSFDTGVSCSGILYLAAGDTVSLAGYQSSGSSQTILGNGNQTWTNLTIRLLG
jgi:hypothetical protein